MKKTFQELIMKKPLIIDYYSDLLCVWAWIAQRRIDELEKKLGNKIEFQHYYVDIFGDVPTKINTQWALKGGYEAFAEHVQKSSSAFTDTPVNSRVWTDVRPNSSANAHLVLKAIEIAYDEKKSMEMALRFRAAFFSEARDIGHFDVLLELAEENSLDIHNIKISLYNGSAMAKLMGDYQKSKSQNVKGSPSYVMDGGRQILYGNVGFRVLLANIEELLKKPCDEASWC